MAAPHEHTVRIYVTPHAGNGAALPHEAVILLVRGIDLDGKALSVPRFSIEGEDGGFLILNLRDLNIGTRAAFTDEMILQGSSADQVFLAFHRLEIVNTYRRADVDLDQLMRQAHIRSGSNTPAPARKQVRLERAGGRLIYEGEQTPTVSHTEKGMVYEIGGPNGTPKVKKGDRMIVTSTVAEL